MLHLSSQILKRLIPLPFVIPIFLAGLLFSGGGMNEVSALPLLQSPPASAGAERVDSANGTGGGGENSFSRNFNWSLPLVQLPGRAGSDLSVSLAYNSLVWTKSGSVISFDDDHGFPSPGFRLGFPIVQFYFNTQLNQNGYLFLAPDGSRVELRQVPGTSLYQAVDSSYLLLDSSTMKLRTGEGTQLSYALLGTDFQCTEIKDRNGNYITINYTSFGRVDTIIDTLNRTIKFNYDGNNAITSITQIWTVNGLPVTHTWASFEYRSPNLTISTNFTNLTTAGASNGSSVKVLSRVILADNSRFEFDYTSWGQVWKISRIANDGQTLLNYRSYNLPLDNSAAQTDCPRFTQRREWARYWNRDISGIEQEAVTSFLQPTSTSWTMPDGTSQSGTLSQVTAPDGTYEKIFSHSSGWDKGLPVLKETYDSSQTRQRQITTRWTQDNIGLAVPLNPRLAETNTYDPQGNRKRVQITYQQFSFPDTTVCSLPQDVLEYEVTASAVSRSTRTIYNLNTAYTSRRIIGLVSDVSVYDGDVTMGAPLASKFSYQYDETGSVQGSNAPVQHDNSNYTSAFVVGRANLSSVKRYDINNISQPTTITRKYNTAGSVVSTADAVNHTIQISYTDSFSDGLARNTVGYPTTYTDADGYTSTATYNYDFGALTYERTPQPNTTSNLPGPERTFTYDSIGRLDRITNLANSAYTRYIYGPNYVRTFGTVNSVADEAHVLRIFDGAGRVIATAMNHPGSVGAFSGSLTVYDAMGRPIKQSNPTETSINIPQPAAPMNPYGWSATGDDAASGWVYSQQTYDWKGRPLVTTNQDGTTSTATYAGCGCAGGEVVTVTDEGTMNGGVSKRRQQKIYSDIFGRTRKTETLNWQNGTVYATTVNVYNARDQVLQITEYAGPEGSPTYQNTVMTYDGYGRLQSRHTPEQTAGATVAWIYNPDDTLQSISDGRGASTTFTYGNARHLPTTVTHALGSGVLTESFTYDADGNRLSMSDASGTTSYHYTQLSQLDSETHTFAGLGGSYTLAYQYTLAGQLKSLTDHTHQIVNYGYDNAGRISSVTGTNYSANQFVNSTKYRAWGDATEIVYGNGLRAGFTYNSRLQAQHFQVVNNIGAAAVSIDYQYHDDGRLKYSHNLLDGRFDRSYEYDHAGRLTKALSGAEARGEPATNNRPYKETATYDEFNHLRTRSSRHWSRTLGFASSDTYANNRRVGWTYDADGNWLAGAGRQQTYDAAGRTNTVTWTYGGQFSQSFDGDGQRVKTAEANSVTYYLRSTVLGGEVIEELNAAGGKDSGFIYANQKLIGYQSANGTVSLLHEDPSGLIVRYSTSQTTSAAYWAELDPWGAEVYGWDPYVDDPQFNGGRGEGGPVFPGFGDISMPSQGCTQMLDGVLSLCDFASRNMNGGGILVERLVRNGTRQMLPVNVALGVGMFWHSPQSGNSSMEIDYREEGDPVIRTNNSVAGYWEIIAFTLNQAKNVKEDDPDILQGENNGEKCGIEVSFKRGTKYENPSVPGGLDLWNGPSIVPAPHTGQRSFGLGFTVTGWVDRGGIGRIGSDKDGFPNSDNPKGRWTIDEETAVWAGTNGQTLLNKPTFSDIHAGVFYEASGNTFSWYDHPGYTYWGNDYSRFENHVVKVYSGKTVCEITFHFIQRGGTIHWGKGLL